MEIHDRGGLLTSNEISNTPVMGEFTRTADLNMIQAACIDDVAKWTREIAYQLAVFNERESAKAAPPVAATDIPF